MHRSVAAVYRQVEIWFSVRARENHENFDTRRVFFSTSATAGAKVEISVPKRRNKRETNQSKSKANDTNEF